MVRCNSCFELYDEREAACPHCGYVPGTPAKEMFHLFPGVELGGRYIIGKVLGFGGFGITYKAWDKKLDTIVAVKEYYPSGIVNRIPGQKEVVIYAVKREKEFYFGKERFLEEARNMAKFNSEPNIVNVFEYFEENNTAYIVMEYLDGISLKEYLHKNKVVLDNDSALKITEAVCNALSVIHSKGIIHRDVSPDNIFLCDNGGIKLIDFGAARFSQDESKLMTIILKPGFAPAEQYEKVNKQGPWTDIYALGATLYYILTARKPEESTNRKINDTLQPPNVYNPAIPEDLSNAIMRAMAVDPNLRYRKISDFLSAIHREKKVLTVEQERKKRKMRRNITVLASVTAVVAIAGISFAQYEHQKKMEMLDACSLSVWYCKSGDAKLDDAELNAYNTIIEEFNATFPDVNIEITGYDESEYAAALQNSENKPNIYEYTGIDSSAKALSLDEVFSSNEAKGCPLLKDVNNYFDDYDHLPLGFSAPIVFINSTMDNGFIGSDESAVVPGMLEGLSSENFSLDHQNVKLSLNTEDSFFSQSALQWFYNEETPAVGTMTTNYHEVRENMPGLYKIYPIEADKIYCTYERVFSAVNSDRKENLASLRFLEYMLNDYAQDIICVQNQSLALPINDNVLSLYVSVNNDFDGVFLNKDKYVFENTEK